MGEQGLQGFADLGSMRIALRAIYRGRRLGLGCCGRKLPVGFEWSCVRRGIDDGRGVVATPSSKNRPINPLRDGFPAI